MKLTKLSFTLFFEPVEKFKISSLQHYLKNKFDSFLVLQEKNNIFPGAIIPTYSMKSKNTLINIYSNSLNITYINDFNSFFETTLDITNIFINDCNISLLTCGIVGQYLLGDRVKREFTKIKFIDCTSDIFARKLGYSFNDKYYINIDLFNSKTISSDISLQVLNAKPSYMELKKDEIYAVLDINDKFALYYNETYKTSFEEIKKLVEFYVEFSKNNLKSIIEGNKYE